MSGAKNRLLSELKAVQKLAWLHVDSPDNDLFVWRLALVVVNPDSDFCGGYFPGELRFTADYPYKPPTFRFTTPLFHPNIYAQTGAVCISILHSPGGGTENSAAAAASAAMSGEHPTERWSPLQGVESVMLSILLLLDNPEIGSPANVDAGVLYRDDRAAYRARARQAVAQSQKLMPAGYVMPTTFDGGKEGNKSGHDVDQEKKEDDDDDDDDAAFWVESDDDGELDFGSDDSDDEQEFDDEEEGQEFDDDDKDKDEKKKEKR